MGLVDTVTTVYRLSLTTIAYQQFVSSLLHPPGLPPGDSNNPKGPNGISSSQALYPPPRAILPSPNTSTQALEEPSQASSGPFRVYWREPSIINTDVLSVAGPASEVSYFQFHTAPRFVAASEFHQAQLLGLHPFPPSTV